MLSNHLLHKEKEFQTIYNTLCAKSSWHEIKICVNQNTLHSLDCGGGQNSTSSGMLHLGNAPFSPFMVWMHDMWPKNNQPLRLKVKK